MGSPIFNPVVKLEGFPIQSDLTPLMAGKAVVVKNTIINGQTAHSTDWGMGHFGTITSVRMRLEPNNSYIQGDGQYLRVNLFGGNGCVIAHASIAKSVPGTFIAQTPPTPLLFAGVDGISISDTSAWSDWIKFPVRKSESYVVIIDTSAGIQRRAGAVNVAWGLWYGETGTYDIQDPGPWKTGWMVNSQSITLEQIDITTPYLDISA